MPLKMVNGKLTEVEDKNEPSVTNPLGPVTNDEGNKLETVEKGPSNGYNVTAPFITGYW